MKTFLENNETTLLFFGIIAAAFILCYSLGLIVKILQDKGYLPKDEC